MDSRDVDTPVFPFLLLILVARQPPVGQGLITHEVSRSHTTTHHSRYDSSGRVISSSQRPLPDNTQHSRQTSMSPTGFEPTISAGGRPQTYVLDRAATETGLKIQLTIQNFDLILPNKYIIRKYVLPIWSEHNYIFSHSLSLLHTSTLQKNSLPSKWQQKVSLKKK